MTRPAEPESASVESGRDRSGNSTYSNSTYHAEARSRVELDVVAVGGNLHADRPRILAIGEAKGGSAARTVDDLRKLERGRTILGEQANTAKTRLLLFSRSGFEPALQEAARRRADLELIDLERLYGGS